MDDARAVVDHLADPGCIPSRFFVEPFAFGHHDVDFFRWMAMVRIDHSRPKHAHADNNVIMAAVAASRRASINSFSGGSGYVINDFSSA